jgi:hypothetical protein
MSLYDVYDSYVMYQKQVVGFLDVTTSCCDSYGMFCLMFECEYMLLVIGQM